MKKPKDIVELITLINERGMNIEDSTDIKKILLNNNYYRLSGYWKAFQDDNGIFSDEITFEQIIGVYNLDKKLRDKLFEGVGIFEVVFRSRFAYFLANSETPYSYLDQQTYTIKYPDLHSRIKQELYRSKELCISHFKKAGEDVPVWAAVEVLSFGTLSKMFSNVNNKTVKKQLYNSFYAFNSYKEMTSVIRALVNLRNLCAHQSRLWNRNAVAPIPKNSLFTKYGTSTNRASWRIITFLCELVDNINENKKYSSEVIRLCKSNEIFYKGLTVPTL